MPLFWLSLAFLSGILLAANLPLATSVWMLLAILPLLLLLPPVYRRWAPVISPSVSTITDQLKLPGLIFLPLLVVFISLGAIRYQETRPVLGPSFIAYYNDRSAVIVLEGVLVDPPDNRDTYTNLRLQADQLRSVGDIRYTPVEGLLLARVSPGTGLQYGDRIRLEGRLETPPENEDFSYRNYLANQNIYSYMSYPTVDLLQHGQGNLILSALYSFRQRALDVVYSLYPDPEASLLAGILLGDQSGISAQVQEAFRLTGTSHIIVISGFNITIIAALFTFLFTRFLGTRRGAHRVGRGDHFIYPHGGCQPSGAARRHPWDAYLIGYPGRSETGRRE